MLEYSEAQFRVGQLRGEQLSLIATELLAQGLDTPALCELAGLSHPTLSEAGPVFERALRELRRPPLDQRAAYERLLRLLLERIADGRVEPREGAGEVWELAFHLEAESRLRMFIGLASEYDDHPEARSEIEAEIRAAAGAELQRVASPPA